MGGGGPRQRLAGRGRGGGQVHIRLLPSPLVRAFPCGHGSWVFLHQHSLPRLGFVFFFSENCFSGLRHTGFPAREIKRLFNF